jgi:hypothetical protein
MGSCVIRKVGHIFNDGKQFKTSPIFGTGRELVKFQIYVDDALLVGYFYC